MRHAVLLLIVLAVIGALCGCFEPRDVPIPPKAQDNHTYAVLDYLLIPALLAVAVGVAMMIWLPVKLPGLGVAGGGAALAVSVLFLHALVSIMVWVVLGVIVLSVGLLIVAFVRHHKALEELATGKPLASSPKSLALVEGIRAKVTKRAGKALMDAAKAVA